MAASEADGEAVVLVTVLQFILSLDLGLAIGITISGNVHCVSSIA